MKFNEPLWITVVGALMLFSNSSLAAAPEKIDNTSSGIAIGYSPDDFTFIANGESFPGEALADPVVTGLHNSYCPDGNGPSLVVVGSENTKIMNILGMEITLSNSVIADLITHLIPNVIVASHLTKGEVIFEQGSVSIKLRIEDRQGVVNAREQLSGPEESFDELIDEATQSLRSQMCILKPKDNDENLQTCPFLWSVTFTQNGTVDTNDCFGSGSSGTDAISTIEGYAHFPKVLIWPSDAYMPTYQEERVCDAFEKLNVSNYSLSSTGETYQKIDGYDGIDADQVSLHASRLGEEKELWIRGYGSIRFKPLQSQLATFKPVEVRSSFVLTGECGVSFTFTPI